jgi:hypothetical protein
MLASFAANRRIAIYSIGDLLLSFIHAGEALHIAPADKLKIPISSHNGRDS